jgi:sialic acid synthase SpsE
MGTYVIAEAGSNHNRDWDLALRLIDAARDAGADAVKFQVFQGQALYARDVPVAPYLVKAGKAAVGSRIADLMDGIAIDRDWLPRLSEACQERGVDFLASPFDADAVLRLDQLGVRYLKIASSEINNFQLLDSIAHCGRPVILSTGMASLADIERAVEHLETGGIPELTLLRCTVKYPAPAAEANLLAMRTLGASFGCPVGFSDHTRDEICAVIAVALGATVIEKHFTIDTSLPGPDHSFALNPSELRDYIGSIRTAEQALGSARVRPTRSEAELLPYRSGLVLRRALRTGEPLTPDAVVMKRPGWGIAPHELPIVLNRRVLQDLPADHILTWSDFLA